MEKTNNQTKRDFRSYEQYLERYFPRTPEEEKEKLKNDPYAYGASIARESLKKLAELRLKQ